MSFDPLNILLLAVALVVIWRLRSVLGTRTGTEKPPFQPYDRRDSDSPKTQDTGATVLDFPQTASGDSRGGEQEDRPAVWAGYAEAGSPLAAVLEALAARDAAFTPRNFLDGAKLAYEMTLEAFAKGDKPGLKNLLSRDVFESFSRVIDQREAGGRRVEQNFVGIDKARIQSARLADTMASITATIRIIGNRTVTITGRQALSAWQRGNDAGQGYAPYADAGAGTVAEAIAAAEADGGTVVLEHDGMTVVQADDGGIYGIAGIADSNGPWAVDLAEVIALALKDEQDEEEEVEEEEEEEELLTDAD